MQNEDAKQLDNDELVEELDAKALEEILGGLAPINPTTPGPLTPRGVGVPSSEPVAWQ